ncbi:MAG: hypothetical protein MUO82_02415 [Candidatus Thermoplasmatota archaeon]|nr:hypothetical protein [Candidatus Thermoplasmatota archaeon]
MSVEAMEWSKAGLDTTPHIIMSVQIKVKITNQIKYNTTFANLFAMDRNHVCW